MTSEESRTLFIESLFSIDEILDLKQRGLYEDYVTGKISINTIYTTLKEQGI